MIFGVTGYSCAGKEEFAKFLKKEGFMHLSLSDEIKTSLKKGKKRVTRKNLIERGNELRFNKGAGELAKRTKKKIKKGKDYVITSIRNKQEVLELRKLKDFLLINVISPREHRFKRMIKRNKKGDSKTFEEFVQRERLEQSNVDTKQQLHIITRMGDIIINNNKTLNLYYMKIDRMLVDWYPKFH